MADYDRDIARELEAAKDVLAIIGEDDADLIADMIEGETGLIESIQKAMDSIDECEVFTVGLTEKINQYQRRKSAIEGRSKRLRAAIEQAMVVLDQKQIRLTTATISLREKPPSLVVSDEAEIPARFWKAGNPTLDRKELMKALKEGEGDEVKGATLDNGGVAMSVRRL